MTSRVDKYEQVAIVILEMVLVVVKNTRKLRKLLDKKSRPLKETKM